MHEDIAAGRDSPLAGGGTIARARIRNVDRSVELAVRIPRVKNVEAFGSFVVALPGLGTDRIAAKSDFIALDHFALLQECKGTIFLQDDDAIGMQSRSRPRLCYRQNGKQRDQRGELSGTHREDYKRVDSGNATLER